MHYGEVILIIGICCSCWQNTHISICALVLFGSILNIKEMLCTMVAQIGCLAGANAVCPLSCCRKEVLPAKRGLFCGGRAMSSSHRCLHCPRLRVGTPGAGVTVPGSTRGCVAAQSEQFSNAEGIAGLNLSRFLQSCVLPWAKTLRSQGTQSHLRPGWTSLQNTHVRDVAEDGCLCSPPALPLWMVSSWPVCHPETKPKERAEINKC